MRAKNTFGILSAACASLALSVVVAQDDLDNLLNDLEASVKPAAAKPTAPAPAPAPAPVAEAAAPAPAEKPAAPAVVEAPAPVPAEKPAAPAVAEAPAPAPAPVPVEKPAAPAVAEAPAPAPAPVPVEKPVTPAEPVVKAKPAHPDAELISDLMSTEEMKRVAKARQGLEEITGARAAMQARNWDEAYKFYRHACLYLDGRPDLAPLLKECEQGMAEAKYQAGKQALKENNRELAIASAEEAQRLRHPRAAALLDVLAEEQTDTAEVDVSAISHRRNDADYKASRDKIRRRLRLASQYMAVLDLNKALEQVDLVLVEDPYNTEAIALRTRINTRRTTIIENEREAARRGMIADIGAAWRPVYAVDSGELKGMDSATMKTPLGGDSERSAEQVIEKRMKEMMLPSISFRPPATIIDAVDFFRQASKDFDRPEIPVDQRGFNFVLQLDKVLTAGTAAAGEAPQANENAFGAAAADEEGAAGDVPVIPNVNASNVSLWEALKLVCQVCKPAYKFNVQGSVVMVMPKTMTTDEMVTRSYSVVEDFIDRMNNASSDLKDQGAGEFGGGGGGDGDGDAGSPEDSWKAFFSDLGVVWPQSSKIKYIKALGKLRVTNTEEQLAVLEDALNELNVTPSMIEVETRFVEVAQEDLNSLGFEWLLNSDYSFNVGGKLSKALNLKDGVFGEVGTQQTGWGQTVDSIRDVTSEVVGTDMNGDPVTRVTDITTTKTSTTESYGKGGIKYQRAPGSGKNVGVNAIDGSTYHTGMRYLSTEGNHIMGEGASANDRFMRVNAFLGNADLSMILHMLSQRSDTDLLSAPKVVTKSGQEATIKVVTIYRYPQDYDVTIQSTSSGSSSGVTGSTTGGSDGKILPMVEPQNFEVQEVGVILTVTPELSAEGNLINLKLNPKVISEPTWRDYGMKVPMASVMSSTAQTLALSTGGDDMQWFNVPMEQPFFKERSIDTVVTLYNGATVVMGGLITEDRKSMEDKIPFLGDIPFLGRFFRSRSEWSNKRNLLLFVTARRVGPDGRMLQSVASSDSEKMPAPKAEKTSEEK